MKTAVRKIIHILIPIGLLVVILTTVYFRQWILTAREISRIRESQKTDIEVMNRGREIIQDISSLQIALRVKLFGPAAAEEAMLSSIPTDGAPKALPASVVSAMNRHGVRLVLYKQAAKSAQLQFEGAYDSVVRFLAAARPDMPQMDEFLMERSDRNLVKLTLTLPVSSA